MMGCRQQQAFVYETHTACSGNRCSLQATSHRSLLLSFISAHHPACHYTPDISISTAMFKFGSKRDLRSDMKCSIRMLNENEVLESVEFSVRRLLVSASFPPFPPPGLLVLLSLVPQSLSFLFLSGLCDCCCCHNLCFVVVLLTLILLVVVSHF